MSLASCLSGHYKDGQLMTKEELFEVLAEAKAVMSCIGLSPRARAGSFRPRPFMGRIRISLKPLGPLVSREKMLCCLLIQW